MHQSRGNGSEPWLKCLRMSCIEKPKTPKHNSAILILILCCMFFFGFACICSPCCLLWSSVGLLPCPASCFHGLCLAALRCFQYSGIGVLCIYVGIIACFCWRGLDFHVSWILLLAVGGHPNFWNLLSLRCTKTSTICRGLVKRSDVASSALLALPCSTGPIQ